MKVKHEGGRTIDDLVWGLLLAKFELADSGKLTDQHGTDGKASRTMREALRIPGLLF